MGKDFHNSVTGRIVAAEIQNDDYLTVSNEAQWSGGNASLYSAFNDAGVECEVGEFLYAMTRIVKPNSVLETGTHWGISATYIGYGLLDNGFGHLDTYEINPQNFRIALNRTRKQGLTDHVDVHNDDVGVLTPQHEFDLMFLDTEPQTRFAELVKFFPYLKEGGYVFIHDLHRHMHQIPNEEHGFAWPYGKIPKQMSALVEEGKLRPFHFGTPRGFTGFYKVSADDYKWNLLSNTQ